MNDDKIIKLQNLLYPNQKEADKLDEKKAQKIIYEALRECLKSKTYRFNIYSYYFDITPQNLSVVYETPDTRIEISNFDVHFETTRQTEARYFVISPEKKEEYDESTKNIEVAGNIIQYDDFICTEQYVFQLNSSTPDDKVKKYLQLLEDCEYYEEELLHDPKTVVIGHDIKKTDKRTDVSLFFNTDQARPVKYDRHNHKFIAYKPEISETYEKYVPSLDRKKQVIETIYSTIVEFYNSYNSK